jgi:Fatty acid hydroxylase superfamily
VNTTPSRRTTDLATKRDIAGAFLRDSSPQVILAALAVLVAVRVLVGGWTLADVAAAALIAAIVGPFEWVVHLFLLHAPVESYRFRVLKLGVGHRQHHLDPPDMDWVTLGGWGAIQYVPQISLIAAVLTLPWLWAIGAPLLAPWLTAVVMGHAALAHYEWTHLLVHTGYRPKTRYYARLRRNHRLHHFRNEHYWLGVTTNAGDRLMLTLPARKTDVPLSETARSLAVSSASGTPPRSR